MNSHKVEYLLVGGYAVNYHGYVRATGDMDVFVRVSAENAERLADALREFGFASATPELFLEPGKIVRMGVPPLRLEVLTGISGVTFEECYEARLVEDFDGVMVNVIGLEHLRRNKRASGRPKDLLDLGELPT